MDFLEFLDRLFLDHGPDSYVSFSTVITRKLRFLVQERRQVQTIFGPLPFSKKRKSSVDIESHIRRERRKRVVRSRNSLVDEWLRLDSTTGVDEAQNLDTFNDLEDFLVDG